MSIRRVAASACALALVLPAAALARPAQEPLVKSQGITYGSTAYVVQNQKYEAAQQSAPGITYGSTVYVPQKHGQSAGITYGSPAYIRQNQEYLAKHAPTGAGGLSSAEVAAASSGAAKPAATPAATTSKDDGVNDWRIAALVEAGLLAALVLGATALVATRRRRATVGV